MLQNRVRSSPHTDGTMHACGAASGDGDASRPQETLSRDPKLEKPIPLDLVICTYNNARRLDDVLAAIAKQQVDPRVQWSVLVVDNNCTDDTADVVARHVAQDRIPKLRRVREQVQGLTPARRRAVSETSAEWVAFVDDDCLLAPDWVAQAAEFAARAEGCGAFAGRVRLVWEVPPPEHLRRYGWCFAEQQHGSEAKELDCLVGAGMVVRRSALMRSGWLECQHLDDRIGRKLVSGGDVEIALRIRAAGFALWYRPSMELCHVIPAERTSLGYLLRMTRSLGESQVLSESMLWSGEFRSWAAATAARSRTSFASLLRRTLELLLGRDRWPDLLLDASFFHGQIRAATRLALAHAVRKRSLLGSAWIAIQAAPEALPEGSLAHAPDCARASEPHAPALDWRGRHR